VHHDASRNSDKRTSEIRATLRGALKGGKPEGELVGVLMRKKRYLQIILKSNPPGKRTIHVHEYTGTTGEGRDVALV